MNTLRTVSLLHVAFRVWRLLDASQRQRCILVILTSMAAACFTVVGVAGVAPFLAVLADPSVVDSNDALAWLYGVLEFQSLEAFLVLLGTGFVALLVVANAVNLLAVLTIGRFAYGVGARFHVLLFEEYLRRDLRFHARNNSDLLANHVVHDVNCTVGGVIQAGLTLLASSASIGLIAAAVVVVNPSIAIGAALTLGVSYAAIYVLLRRRLVRDGTSIAHWWGERAKLIAEGFEAIKDVVVFRAQRQFAAQVARHSERIAAAQARTAAMAVSPRYLLEVVTATGLVGAAFWIYGTAGSRQWLTHLALLGFAAYRLLPPTQQAFAAVARVRSDGVAFERIAADLLRAREALIPVLPPLDDAWRERPRHEIRLVRVSYRHASERPGGVSNVSLAIPAGAVVGLVGQNGSGKTTLADLILGLRVPDAGVIEVDGIPLDEHNRELWMTAVAYVPQHIVTLDTSMAENIAFGVPAESIDFNRVQEVVREARLESLLHTMPEGLATRIGQNGVQLSGGQRQRVGIARALYRPASLLVMDEATSSLDTLTEAEVIGLLDRLRGRRTTIVIGHRASALLACDRLFELQGGRLVGSPSPAEWLRESRGIERAADNRR